MTTPIRFTPDQARAASFGDRPGRHIHVSGAQRSGKNLTGVYGFLDWAGRNFTNHRFGCAAKTYGRFQSNILSFMHEFCKSRQIGISRDERNWRIESDDYGYNTFVPVLFSGSASGGSGGVGASGGALPAARLEGETFAGAIIDEAMECPEFMLMTITDRCSVRGAKIVYCYYPQGKLHPLQIDNVDKVQAGIMSGEVHRLRMEDNPSLSAEYIAEQKAKWQHIPHEYERRILGLPSSATGIVFEGFEQYLVEGPSQETVDGIVTWVGVCDWASSSVSCCLLFGFHPGHGKWYVCHEWSHDGRKVGARATDLKVSDMIASCEAVAGKAVDYWIIDPNEDGLRVELKRTQTGLGRVIDAVAQREEGLKTAMAYLGAGGFRISQHKCPGLVRDMSMLSWDRKQAVVGKDVMDKASADGAHFADCFRYFCHTYEETFTNKSGLLAKAA